MTITFYEAVLGIANDYYPEENLTSYRHAMDEMRMALSSLAGMNCKWEFDSGQFGWWTSCSDRTRPKSVRQNEDPMTFCPFCGKRIVMLSSGYGGWNE